MTVILNNRLMICLLAVIFCIQQTKANREILYRSQSADTARELVGWTHKINIADQAGIYGAFALTGQYTCSFDYPTIASHIFGDTLLSPAGYQQCPPTFTVAGSRVAHRDPFDLLADYFGLPTDFVSSVTVEPRITNQLVDMNLYLGLNDWLCGLWLRIHAPVVHTSWRLNLCETIINQGTIGYDAGYFSPTAVPVTDLNHSFSSYLQGSAPRLTNPTGAALIFLPLVKDVVTNNKFMTTKLSDIQLSIGWNFYLDEDYHLGVGLAGSIPTGSIIGRCNQLFQPVVGNGHHLELGALLTSHYTLWRSCDNDKSLGLYADARITHLFNTMQFRTFDLIGAGSLSKYILLEQLTAPVTNSLEGSPTQAATGPAAGNTTAAISQFNSLVSPAANITNAAIKVSIPVQADITALLNYTHGNFECDIAYNLWATSCEKMKLCSSEGIIPGKTWSIKGDSYVFGFDQSTTDPALFLSAPLSATQSQATIYSGLNFNSSRTVAEAAVNPGIDNAEFAYADAQTPATITRRLYSTDTIAGAVPANHTQTSIQPIFLNDDNLNIQNALKKGLTQKLVLHLNYTWYECLCIIPYFGIGGMIECTQKNKNYEKNRRGPLYNECITDCDQNPYCLNGSLSQWGLWIKGGVSF